ncbi:hypothetical protein BDV98DRAFT_625743 [Pterulicium gracile]|uniref:Frag1/DRAM/Sfk1 family-domain-containing protein n=1 Tax=Pterulicium gracile TaxID=1884261 RepID=A0A5C3QBP8_9AGAR|nr:hypothetical protein BDV98DRAFT_625743 [Pterula gracilis]
MDALTCSASIRCWLILAVLAYMSLVTLDWCMRMLPLIKAVQFFFLDEGTMSFQDRRINFSIWNTTEVANHFLIVWLCPNSSDIGLLFILTDVMTCWRATAICARDRYRSSPFGRMLRLAPWFLIFLSFALWVAYCGIDTYKLLLGEPDAGVTLNSGTMVILLITASVASITANLLATGMIGYETWKYTRSVTVPRAVKVQHRASRVLLFLTEFGLFYAVIQIVRLAMSLSVGPSTPVYGSLYTASVAFKTATTIVTMRIS